MQSFSTNLLHWYDDHKRILPWRDTNNAYLIWISEIMLQQTRVDQATPYILRFIERFPTVEKLAEAELHDVLVLWEGLGYYSRARNLHKGAQMVANEFGGIVPETYDKIKSIPGIGDYTAAAVLSIAYNKPHAVVDGNVIRVLARHAGIQGDVRGSAVKQEIQSLADKLLDKKRPGDFNQALMELGSVQCKPRNPVCEDCPVQTDCVAYQKVMVDVIPYKSPAKKRPHHNIGVGIIHDNRGNVLIARRPESAMLGGLWEFPGGKQEKQESFPDTVARELKEELDVDVQVGDFFMDIKHAYSHFTIHMHAYFCTIKSGSPKPKTSDEIRWLKINELPDYPFPKANRKLTEVLVQKVVASQ
ncbi:MAG: A/G-specific adenine glycosylase [Balneolales bacterium]